MKNGKYTSQAEFIQDLKKPCVLSVIFYKNNPQSFYKAVVIQTSTNAAAQKAIGSLLTGYAAPNKKQMAQMELAYDAALRNGYFKIADVKAILSAVPYNSAATNFTTSPAFWSAVGLSAGDFTSLISNNLPTS
jgi:hypothetical protein